MSLGFLNEEMPGETVMVTVSPEHWENVSSLSLNRFRMPEAGDGGKGPAPESAADTESVYNGG